MLFTFTRDNATNSVHIMHIELTLFKSQIHLTQVAGDLYMQASGMYKIILCTSFKTNKQTR